MLDGVPKKVLTILVSPVDQVEIVNKVYAGLKKIYVKTIIAQK